MSGSLHIVVTVALIYLAIGAALWALLVAHAAVPFGWRIVIWTLALCCFKWPRYLGRFAALLWAGVRP